MSVAGLGTYQSVSMYYSSNSNVESFNPNGNFFNQKLSFLMKNGETLQNEDGSSVSADNERDSEMQFGSLTRIPVMSKAYGETKERDLWEMSYDSLDDGHIDIEKLKAEGKTLRDAFNEPYHKYVNNTHFIGKVYTEQELWDEWNATEIEMFALTSYMDDKGLTDNTGMKSFNKMRAYSKQAEYNDFIRGIADSDMAWTQSRDWISILANARESYFRMPETYKQALGAESLIGSLMKWNNNSLLFA